jgi:hypothetical protein
LESCGGSDAELEHVEECQLGAFYRNVISRRSVSIRPVIVTRNSQVDQDNNHMLMLRNLIVRWERLTWESSCTKAWYG